MDHTNEFSFLLQPSLYGVGVFAAHDIQKGTPLRLFADLNPVRHLKKEEVPAAFEKFCAQKEHFLIAPPDFGYMPIGWYLNHSNEPNAMHDPHEEIGKYGLWLAARDIMEGEEITINYNALEEPDHHKEEYYLKKS